MTDNLRIGIPSKGRLAEMASELLIEAGLKFRRQERSLFARVRDMPIEITFLRTDDIPVLCAEGAIDMGITGGDLLDETGVDLTTRLALGMGNWRLAICVLEDSKIKKPADLANCRIATSFPNVTQKYLDKHKVTAHVVQLTGSVEVMITLGIADAIVDLVETGSTLAANRLTVLDELGHGTRACSCRTQRQSARSWPTASFADWKASSSPAATRCSSTTCPRQSLPRPKRSRPVSSPPRSASWKKPAGLPSARWSSKVK